MSFKRKTSFVDSILEMLPEVHIPGYNFCGPNTNLEKRLVDCTPGINELDCACKEHDIAYSGSTDLQMRYIADKILVLKVIRRVFARNVRIGERYYQNDF